MIGRGLIAFQLWRNTGSSIDGLLLSEGGGVLGRQRKGEADVGWWRFLESSDL